MGVLLSRGKTGMRMRMVWTGVRRGGWSWGWGLEQSYTGLGHIWSNILYCGGYFSGNQESRGRTVWRPSINGKSRGLEKGWLQMWLCPICWPWPVFPTNLDLDRGQGTFFSSLILRLEEGGNHHGLVSIFFLRRDVVNVLEEKRKTLLPSGAVQGSAHRGHPAQLGLEAFLDWVCWGCLWGNPPEPCSAGWTLCGDITVISVASGRGFLQTP